MEKFENLTERRLDTRPIYDGKILHVRLDTVELPNGKTATREYLEHGGAVCVLPLLSDGTVLMERQYRYPVGQVILEIPAGKLDHLGEDPLDCAHRELEEETGLRAQHMERLTPMVTTPGFCTERVSIYLATGLIQAAAHLDDDEFLNVVRMPLREAVTRVMCGELNDGKTALGLLMAWQRLGLGAVPLA